MTDIGESKSLTGRVIIRVAAWLLFALLSAGPGRAAGGVIGGVIFTCPAPKGTEYNVERDFFQAGNQEAGWAPTDRGSGSFIQLHVGRDGGWEIVQKNSAGTFFYKSGKVEREGAESPPVSPCPIVMPDSPKDDHTPDMLLIAVCSLHTDTFLFARRNGTIKLLWTQMWRGQLGSGAALFTADCRDGK
jgi:hypothetical protein